SDDEANNSQETSEEKDGKEKDDEDKKPTPITIDLDSITERVLPFPVAEGRYAEVRGIKGKALFLSFPVEGVINQDIFRYEPKGVVEYYDFENYKSEKLLDSVSDFELSRESKTLIYRSFHRLRVLKAGDKPKSEGGDRPGRESGWVDLHRVKVSVQPSAEWKQMFAEAWRLQREQFWTADMSGIDWEAVYKQYAPLVDRVGSRSELSDLLWELQGELGTSHAYEIGGEYRHRPHYHQGFLGVDWTYDAENDRYRIEHIVKGDPSDTATTSPLTSPGLNVAEGDAVLA